MIPFTVHHRTTAPAGSRPFLEAANDAYGFVPNLLSVLAEAPASLEAYLRLSTLLAETSSFTQIEEQIVLLASSYQNRCAYCMAAHSTIAIVLNAPDGTVEALRADRPLPDPKHDALATFTRAVARNAGRVNPTDTEAFVAAGYTTQHILEVILGVATTTISNHASHFARPEIDQQFQAGVWTPRADTIG